MRYTLVIGGGFYLGLIGFSLVPQKIEIPQKAVKEFSPRLEAAKKRDLVLFANIDKIIIKKEEISKWIEPYIRDYSGKSDARIVYSILSDYLESMAPKFEIEPVNARIRLKNNRAEIFTSSSPGYKLNTAQSIANITTALLESMPSASLVFEEVEPEITLEKINNLGLNTLLGRGTSDYGKSPASRIHNIKIGMSKFNGIILKPDEEFSFNKFLGEVDDVEGYQAELVIKSGKLEKEYGGGLCQVSTTVFRAAILAGLPITERKPHSFPVQYYNPQGFDSTIYPGVVDLKFVNDTPNHILIQTKVTGSKLSVEIYGTADNRKVAMEGPIQYDQKSNGSMKAYFIRDIITSDGIEKKERFDSIYKPPPLHERNPLE